MSGNARFTEGPVTAHSSLRLIGEYQNGTLFVRERPEALIRRAEPPRRNGAFQFVPARQHVRLGRVVESWINGAAALLFYQLPASIYAGEPGESPHRSSNGGGGWAVAVARQFRPGSPKAWIQA